jgi:exonuclease SbcC
MLRRIKIRNFQSLRDVDIDLGSLTVVIGPSSSGKTALIRALRTIMGNSRGAGWITYGEKTAALTVAGDDARGKWAVKLDRSPTTANYIVGGGAGAEIFTKLGGSVPLRVSELFGISATAGPGLIPLDLAVASQFDRPYLLDETGSKVAMVLGDLTNVSIIFEAAKEANRRKLNLGSQLRTRQDDARRIGAEIDTFADLPARQAALEEAERLAGTVAVIEAKLGRLDMAVVAHEAAEAALGAMAPVGEVPSFEPIDHARSRLYLFLDLLRQAKTSGEAIKAAEVSSTQATAELAKLEKELHEALVRAGTCPTCNQKVK